MRGEIKRLCQRLGATTLYVTHDQAEALTMADLIAVMSAGELQQLAPPDEIYERPANRFVATFVGNPPMNVLRGRVDESGLHVGGATVADSSRQRHAACRGAGVAEIGVRPEDLRFGETGTRSALCPARSMSSSRWATRRWSTCASAASALRCAPDAASRRGSDRPIGVKLRSRRCLLLRFGRFHRGASRTNQRRKAMKRHCDESDH